MNFYELAQRLVTSVIAVALNTTVAVVGRMLPHRPDWLERVDLLAAQFRSVATKAADDADKTGKERIEPGFKEEAETAPRQESEQLLGAYNSLWRFTQKIREQGLSLDDEFCTRVEREWTTSALLGYLRALDTSLQDEAENALAAAGEFLAPESRP